jgi:hypothetical protein
MNRQDHCSRRSFTSRIRRAAALGVEALPLAGLAVVATVSPSFAATKLFRVRRRIRYVDQRMQFLDAFNRRLLAYSSTVGDRAR